MQIIEWLNACLIAAIIMLTADDANQAFLDSHNDKIPDIKDNCPYVLNPYQHDH